MKLTIQDPIETDFIFEHQISDHKPIINEGVLSWNIMMQGRQRNETSFNNGFRIIETQQQYQERLALVVTTLAEIISTHPEVSVIALQEAPIKPSDIKAFANAINKFGVLTDFATTLDDEHLVSAWGLMTLVNIDKDEYQHLPTVFSAEAYEFNERAHVIRIYNTDTAIGYTDVMNVHMPYRLHNQADKVSDTIDKLVYAIERFAIPEHHIVCGDLNVNPNLLSQPNENVFSKPENNIQSRGDGSRYRENVDAVISVGRHMLGSRFSIFRPYTSETKTHHILSSERVNTFA